MSFVGTLYPFQEEAHDLMVDRGSAMVCMVMGAGKTPTTLSALEALFDSDDISRALIVVPASLKYQWLSEIKRFCSDGNTSYKAVVIDGPPKGREALWRAAVSARYIIVNPELLQRDMAYLGKVRVEAIVIDEATMIKSRTTKRSRFLKQLGKRAMYRFALTGQPIENRPEELFSIMEFVDPSVLGKFNLFDDTFIVRDHWGKPSRYRNLHILKSSLSDVMIRKTREDIQDQLPTVINKVIPVSFDPAGASAYQKITSDLLRKIHDAVSTGKMNRTFDLWKHYNDSEGSAVQGEIMSRLTVLRMLCDNPEVVRLSADLFADKATNQGSSYARKVIDEGVLKATSKSPKLDAGVG